jgi:cell division protein ZapA (FtsZ GTPase activity inhibitor)
VEDLRLLINILSTLDLAMATLSHLTSSSSKREAKVLKAVLLVLDLATSGGQIAQIRQARSRGRHRGRGLWSRRHGC